MYTCHREIESTNNILKSFCSKIKGKKPPKSCYKINIALIPKLGKYSTRKKNCGVISLKIQTQVPNKISYKSNLKMY